MKIVREENIKNRQQEEQQQDYARFHDLGVEKTKKKK